MNQPLTVVPKTDAASELDQACALLQLEKARLAKIQQNIREAEQAIVALVGAKDEGSFSIESDRYKITTNQPVSRSVDVARAKSLMKSLPKDIADGIFTWKPSLSVRVYKELEKYQPETYREISRAVTAKPGKVSVKVEAIEE